MRHTSGDITKRPAVVIRTEHRDMNENNLQRTDIRNVSLSLYRERRRPKIRDETNASITKIDTMTSKQENFVIMNDQDSGIVIFSTASNAACLCNDVEDLFIDGTFKCCPRYFYQLYTRHPNIFIFLDVLQQIQTSTYIKIRSLDTPVLQRRMEVEKMNYSLEKYQDYLSGTTSRCTYISSLGYKFSARTDM